MTGSLSNSRKPWPNGHGVRAKGDILPVEVFMQEVYQHLQGIRTIHQNFFEHMAELGKRAEKSTGSSWNRGSIW